MSKALDKAQQKLTDIFQSIADNVQTTLGNVRRVASDGLTGWFHENMDGMRRALKANFKSHAGEIKEAISRIERHHGSVPMALPELIS